MIITLAICYLVLGFYKILSLYFIFRFLAPLSIPVLPDQVPPYVEQRKLSQAFYEHEKWGRILEVSDIASLNRMITTGKGGDLIRLAEAFQEKRIAQIADEITRDRERVRLVMIAGPSSSGKTTFTQRLSIQLRVNGVRPVSLSLDDYFVSREFTPRDEKGEPDFEALEAIDLALFNEQLTIIMGEKSRDSPAFTGRQARIPWKSPNQSRTTYSVGDPWSERKTNPIGRKTGNSKVYISALTQLNMDNHNRIPTTDNRLIRRIVRDNKFRSHDALTTLRLWPAVRQGEEKKEHLSSRG